MPIILKTFGVFNKLEIHKKLLILLRTNFMQDFSRISVEETLNKLNTSLRELSDEEAENRVEKYGYNEIPEKRINPVLKFLSYFWGPIP